MVLHTPQEEQLLRRVAATVRQWGLRGIALTALQAGRPLALVAGQLLWIAQPALSLRWSAQQIGRWAKLLEEPRTADYLVSLLDGDE